MSDTQRNIIRIDDLDMPIFRIYSKKWFMPILDNGTDALRNPSSWDDPFENFFLKRTRVDIGSGQLADLESIANDWYGQCWSIKSDTDGMWRIYSSDKTGIQVMTTVRKLFENLKQVCSTAPNLQFYVGRVKYQRPSDLAAMMAKLTFTDVVLGGQGDGFANLLCVKREAFHHEEEVRILFQDIDTPRRGLKQSFVYKVDPNVVFEELVLDPRLDPSAAGVLEGDLRAAGCKIPIRRSDLYDVPSFTISA